MTPHERIKLLNDIGTCLQSQFTTQQIDQFLASYGVEYEKEPMAKSKRLYASNALSPYPNDLLIQIAKDLDMAVPVGWQNTALPSLPLTSYETPAPIKTLHNNITKKVFISHSSKDAAIIEKIIDLLRVIGVNPGSIFCSSFEGYGINLGENFLDTIKRELSNDVLVLFALSENFYASPVCLCEMGAAWVTTKAHIPILIPPFEFKDVKGVFPNTQGLILTDKGKVNSLKEHIENFLNLHSVKHSIWERDRDNILAEIEQILQHNKE